MSVSKAIILGKRNGVGLDRDAAVLSAVFTLERIETESAKPRNLVAPFSPRYNGDIAVHLERVSPSWWRRKATRHILIPNQERFPRRLIGTLDRIDEVWCKSRHAEEVFRNLGKKVKYIGFSSLDREIPSTNPDYDRFFHLAGSSTMKNTKLLLSLWEKHPEWPTLTLIQHPSNAPEKVPANVNLVAKYMDDQVLKSMQNEHGIHLCPSISEGWGHYLVEGMSCRAVVLTTDAPPMNEIVDSRRGLLVPFSESEKRHLGTVYRTTPENLERAIKNLLVMPQSEKRELGDSAREWFVHNEAEFYSRFHEALISGTS